jgi:hypothetical protein
LKFPVLPAERQTFVDSSIHSGDGLLHPQKNRRAVKSDCVFAMSEILERNPSAVEDCNNVEGSACGGGVGNCPSARAAADPGLRLRDQKLETLRRPEISGRKDIRTLTGL